MPRSSRRAALDGVTADGSTHAGLWFDAMLDKLPEKKREGQRDDRDEADAGLYREHLLALAGRGVPAGYGNAVAAWESALRGWSGALEGAVTRMYEASATGRLIVGLGEASLTETHVALQRTWGVPFLPGSALKGLASSTAHRSGDPAWQRAETHTPGGSLAQVLFGDTTSAGVVTFHDAWWVPDSDTKLPLDLDVMTVHHADYYMEGAVPADWDGPNPVAFVTARGTYRVALTGPEDWVTLAFEWLKLGLARDGIGAKTHAGYGRMHIEKKLSTQEQALDAATRSLDDLPARYAGPSNRRVVIQALLDAQQKGVTGRTLEDACQRLYAKDTRAWRDWLKEPARTEAEKALFATCTAPVAAPLSTVQPTAPQKPPVEALPWLPAMGWIVKDKHLLLRVRVGGAKPIERKVKDVTLEGDIGAALEAATEMAPVAVEVQLKGESKLQAARRPTAGS